MAKTRLAKLEGMEKYLEKENCYLGEHPGRGIAGTEHTGSHEKKTSSSTKRPKKIKAFMAFIFYFGVNIRYNELTPTGILQMCISSKNHLSLRCYLLYYLNYSCCNMKNSKV